MKCLLSSNPANRLSDLSFSLSMITILVIILSPNMLNFATASALADIPISEAFA